jgi:hypothetical protein
MLPVDTPRSDRGPEEMILDGWLDENEPYLSLEERTGEQGSAPGAQEPGVIQA